MNDKINDINTLLVPRAPLAAPAQAVPASVIMASVMRDDGGEHPAFCLMVAYRAEKDAMAALAMLTDDPTQASEYPPLVCDYCGALTPDPWHSSGMLHGKMSKHIHSCDACAARGATQASPVDANVQAAVPADLMTFTSSTQPALQQAHHEEQPDGTTIPIDPSEMAPQQPAPAPMSPANRLVAYSAATRLRELGFEWDATAEAWLQPAPSAQAADSVLEDAARYRWLREGNDAKHGAA